MKKLLLVVKHEQEMLRFQNTLENYFLGTIHIEAICEDTVVPGVIYSTDVLLTYSDLVHAPVCRSVRYESYTPLGRLLGENSPVLNEKSAKIQAFSPNNDRCKIMALYSKQVGGRPLNVAMERSTGPLLTVGTGRGSSPACFGFRGEKRSVEIWSERLHRSEGQKI